MGKLHILAGAMLLMACTGNKSVAAEGDAATDLAGVDAPTLVKSDTLVFEVVEFQDSSRYKVKVVDYSSDEDPAPYEVETVTDTYQASSLKAVGGKPEVVEFINQWLTLDAAGKTPGEDVTAETVAAEYAKLKKEAGIADVKAAMKQASLAYLSGQADDEEEMLELPFASANDAASNILFKWQTPTLLTLWDGGYEYNAGAAHGMPWGYGRTFDLKNLRLLTLDDIITKEGRETVLKMIIAQLQKEYKEELDMMNPADEIDFPGMAPSLMAEGVSFDYGAYEIGAYALGMPGVIVPYNKLKPYLTPEVKTLLGLK